MGCGHHGKVSSLHVVLLGAAVQSDYRACEHSSVPIMAKLRKKRAQVLGTLLQKDGEELRLCLPPRLGCPVLAYQLSQNALTNCCSVCDPVPPLPPPKRMRWRRSRFLPALLRLIPLADELNGPFTPKDPVTDR